MIGRPFQKGHTTNVGRVCSIATRKKLSEKMIGKVNPMYGKHHSIKSRKVMSEKHKGEKASNWKDGITPISKLIRDGLDYKVWRKSCLIRDNFTCKRCEKYGGKLQVHHINNFADFIELRFITENGFTFCEECHKEFHKIYGKKNNTREQLLESLENKTALTQRIKAALYYLFSFSTTQHAKNTPIGMADRRSSRWRNC